MKDLKDSTVGATVLHKVGSDSRKTESHAPPGYGIDAMTLLIPLSSRL